MPYNTKEKRIQQQKRYRQVNKEYKIHNKEYMRRKRLDIVFCEKERKEKKRKTVLNKIKARKHFGCYCNICRKKVHWDFNTVIHHTTGSNKHKGNALGHPKLWMNCVVLCRMCHRILHTIAEKLDKKAVKYLIELRENLCHKEK